MCVIGVWSRIQIQVAVVGGVTVIIIIIILLSIHTRCSTSQLHSPTKSRLRQVSYGAAVYGECPSMTVHAAYHKAGVLAAHAAIPARPACFTVSGAVL